MAVAGLANNEVVLQYLRYACLQRSGDAGLVTHEEFLESQDDKSFHNDLVLLVGKSTPNGKYIRSLSHINLNKM